MDGSANIDRLGMDGCMRRALSKIGITTVASFRSFDVGLLAHTSHLSAARVQRVRDIQLTLLNNDQMAASHPLVGSDPKNLAPVDSPGLDKARTVAPDSIGQSLRADQPAIKLEDVNASTELVSLTFDHEDTSKQMLHNTFGRLTAEPIEDTVEDNRDALGVPPVDNSAQTSPGSASVPTAHRQTDNERARDFAKSFGQSLDNKVKAGRSAHCLRPDDYTDWQTILKLRGSVTMKVTDAALLYGISRGLAYREARAGRIPAKIFGDRILVLTELVFKELYPEWPPKSALQHLTPEDISGP